MIGRRTVARAAIWVPSNNFLWVVSCCWVISIADVARFTTSWLSVVSCSAISTIFAANIDLGELPFALDAY